MYLKVKIDDTLWIKVFLKSLNNHSLILDFVYAHRAGWNGQIGSVWLTWKIFVYAVLFWAKKASEITLWMKNRGILKILETLLLRSYDTFTLI